MEIKELKFSDLTVEQKLGMVMCGRVNNMWDEAKTEANIEYAINMIKEHKLGAIWVTNNYKFEETMARIKAAADYPILICTDAESGFGYGGGEVIGQHNAIGMCGTTESAYAFGKVTAVKARKAGYNVVCNPVLDMVNHNALCASTNRSMGSDKYKVAELGAAEAQGMHDGGVLTVGKHFPSAGSAGTVHNKYIDSHMAESFSNATKEDIIDYCWYPYLELCKKGLLDGVMTGHSRVPALDTEHPSSLSKKTIDLFREHGFDGFTITDALCMGGVIAKYGIDGSRGLSIAGGNNLALIWDANKDGYESLLKCYKDGLIPDDILDEAVKGVLAAQHKVTLLDTSAEITEEDLVNYHKLNTDGIFAKTDDGVDVALPKDKKYYFIIMCHNEANVINNNIDVDTMSKLWYNPVLIKDKLMENYPGSDYRIIKELPSSTDGWRITEDNLKYDEVVFVTFTDGKAYQGCEDFTPRILSFFAALQVTNRISTVLHFGNPFVLEDLPHVSRLIVGGNSSMAVNAGINVLIGEHEAKGSLTYDVKLK